MTGSRMVKTVMAKLGTERRPEDWTSMWPAIFGKKLGAGVGAPAWEHTANSGTARFPTAGSSAAVVLLDNWAAIPPGRTCTRWVIHLAKTGPATMAVGNPIKSE